MRAKVKARVLRVQVAALLVVMAATSLAEAGYKIKNLRGKIECSGKPVAATADLPDACELKSSDPEAYVVLRGEGRAFVLRGEFEFQLPDPAKKEKVLSAILKKGLLRVNVDRAAASVLAPSDSIYRFKVTTPAAVAGVRGTDFMVSFSPMLGEAEVICFESEVDLAPDEKAKPTLIKTGQWGGRGGRFGQKIAPPLNLPKNVLDHFTSLLPWK